MEKKTETVTYYKVDPEDARVLKDALNYTYHRIVEHEKGPVHHLKKIDELRKVID